MSQPISDDGEPGNLPELFENALKVIDTLTSAYERLRLDTEADQQTHDRLIATARETTARMRVGIEKARNHWPRLFTDHDANASYVTMMLGEIAATQDLGDGIRADLNADGVVLGYEIFH